jgi:hypothetical protein
VDDWKDLRPPRCAFACRSYSTVSPLFKVQISPAAEPGAASKNIVIMGPNAACTGIEQFVDIRYHDALASTMME